MSPGTAKRVNRRVVSPRPTACASGPDSGFRQDRGVVAIEFLVVLPVLIFLFLALLETGAAWSTRTNLTEGLRSSTYVAAIRTDEPASDLAVMQSILAELGSRNAGNIVSVAVYDPTTADLNTCMIFAGLGGYGDCVVYDTQTILDVANGNVTAADFGGATCDGTDLDRVWCAPGRMSIDHIAVRVVYQHDWVSGVFPGNGLRLQDSAVLRTL